MSCPFPRFERFYIFENADGGFHILVVAGDGGYIFADNINSRKEADWLCGLLNAALEGEGNR